MIDEMNITIKDDKVIIPKEEYAEESEIHYLIFILGYDLLHETFARSQVKESDINYDFCDYLARHFIKSDEYQNTKYSTYEMLSEWLNTNKTKIRKEYKDFIKDRDYEDIER